VISILPINGQRTTGKENGNQQAPKAEPEKKSI
jgi:hypothetical protein